MHQEQVIWLLLIFPWYTLFDNSLNTICCFYYMTYASSFLYKLMQRILIKYWMLKIKLNTKAIIKVNQEEREIWVSYYFTGNVFEPLHIAILFIYLLHIDTYIYNCKHRVSKSTFFTSLETHIDQWYLR